MARYEVQITAEITKTYEIEAPDSDSAIEEAHQVFKTTDDGVEDDHYIENVVGVPKLIGEGN